MYFCITETFTTPMKGPLFYAKILLFGEYGIIKESKGLAIPFNSYKGALKTVNTLNGEAKKSNENLLGFHQYLKEHGSELIQLDLKSFKCDINNGMYFDSSIPQGYGVGSSGALVASIYDKYASKKITVLENLTRNKLLTLKETFSIMESYFHGKSSGLDPLNSYLSLPILINSKENIEATGIPSQKDGRAAVFLLDSEQIGETEPMVNIFMNKMKNKGFRKMLSDEFSIHTDACIEDFLQGNIKSLFGNVKKLSKVVFKNFKPMIPSAFHKVWEKGIRTNDYYLKLCGSGGGGYILGFTEDYEKAKISLKDYKLELVYRF